jgi:hypothetical protein
VIRRLIEDQDQAEQLGMRGSPTLLVDGIDPFAEPGTGGAPPSVTYAQAECCEVCNSGSACPWITWPTAGQTVCYAARKYSNTAKQHLLPPHTPELVGPARTMLAPTVRDEEVWGDGVEVSSLMGEIADRRPKECVNAGQRRQIIDVRMGGMP